MFNATRKDIAKSVKTLLILLQSMHGKQVTLTLRNDTLVEGILLNVDANMNIQLKHASVQSDLFYNTTTTSTSIEHVGEVRQVANNDHQQPPAKHFLPLANDPLSTLADAAAAATRQLVSDSTTTTTTTTTTRDLISSQQSSRAEFEHVHMQTGSTRGPAPNDNLVTTCHGTLTGNDDESFGEQSDDDSVCALADATVKRHEYLLVKGSRVRHVDIPADCDLLGGAQRQLQRVRDRRKQWTKRDIVKPTTSV